MDAILHFLLPKQPLEFLFLILLIICILSALSAAYYLKIKLIETNNTNSLSISQSSYENLSRHPIAENVIENSAGFCLIIGLLGTFLGIGMAIQDAGNVLVSINDNVNLDKSMADTLGKLNPVLSEIGMKFKVSTWGIISSILIRLSLPLFNIEGIKQNILTNRITSENKIKLEEEDRYRKDLMRVLDSIADTNLLIKNSLEDAIKIPENIDKSSSELLVVTNSLNNTVDKLENKTDEHLKNIDLHTEDLKNNTDLILREMNQSINDFKKDMQKTFNDFSTLSNNTSNSLEAMSLLAKNLIEKIEAIIDAEYMDDLLEHIQQVNHNTSNLIDTNDSLREVITINHSLESLIQQTNQLSQGNALNLVDMKDRLIEILTINHSLESLIQETNQLSQRINDSINRNKSLDRAIIRMG